MGSSNNREYWWKLRYAVQGNTDLNEAWNKLYDPSLPVDDAGLTKLDKDFMSFQWEWQHTLRPGELEKMWEKIQEIREERRLTKKHSD